MNRFFKLGWINATLFLLGSTLNVFGQAESNPQPYEVEASAEAKRPTDPPKLSKPNKFLRMQRGPDGEPRTLQTAITSYRIPNRRGGIVIDLIGAVHVGDREYYQALNKQFEAYDVVLYELVAPKGTRVPKGGGERGGGNPISMLQGMTQSMLNLASQMEEVDYTKANFVHADMSPSEMQAKMAERGESTVTVLLDAASSMMKQSNLRQQQAIANDQTINQLAADPISLIFDPQRDSKLKVMMAEQFATMGTDMMGQTVNRLLVEDRNKAAMQVLVREMAKGHKRIAIFYGAAHLPDFEERLLKMDLQPAETKWLTAWDLTKKSKKKDDLVDNLLRQLLQPPEKVAQ